MVWQTVGLRCDRPEREDAENNPSIQRQARIQNGRDEDQERAVQSGGMR